MPKGGRPALGALLCAAAAACGPSKPSPPPPSEAAGRGAPAAPASAGAAPALAGAAANERGPFRIATFNAGLAVGYLPYAEERAPLVVDALARAPADLLCVQEFWLEAHWQALRTAAAPRFPHAYRLPPAAGAAAGPTCSRAELAPLVACARQHCGGAGPGGLGGCVLQHCAEGARHMSADCLNCLIRNPVGGLETITAACSAPDPPGPVARAAPAPRPGAEVFAYGGSFGTGLLSREPLLETDALVFDATLNPRAALYARLRPASLGDLHVVCTHLTPALSAPLGRGSPTAEQRAQVERLLAWIDQKARDGAPVALVGDLNAGPRAGGADALLPQHYAKLLGAGFRNPYAARPDARCTFCPSNPLNGGGPGRGALIDHVLLRGYAGGASVEPFLREPVELEVGGRKLLRAYSDHYGLVATLSPAGG
ncbi:MAG TPA: endonuclease/exonuclease/phosphatase family protein [Polyangiaceae bacterium]|nr:endonuclease/exonuclease/phosphatase family protein [Polyangiaceae bacterium]